MVSAAGRLEDLACDYVIHHIGYDERRGIAARRGHMPSPFDQLREVVAAVRVPVQAVGGLTLEQAVRTRSYGVPKKADARRRFRRGALMSSVGQNH